MRENKYPYFTVLKVYKSYRNQDTMPEFMAKEMARNSGCFDLRVFATKDLAQDWARKLRDDVRVSAQYSRGPSNGKYSIVVKRCDEYAEFKDYPINTEEFGCDKHRRVIVESRDWLL